MSEFEKGEMIWVTNREDQWVDKIYRKFIIEHNCRYFCEQKPNKDMLGHWLFARKIPVEKKKIIPGIEGMKTNRGYQVQIYAIDGGPCGDYIYGAELVDGRWSLLQWFPFGAVIGGSTRDQYSLNMNGFEA